jgi:WD40 repeat protein
VVEAGDKGIIPNSKSDSPLPPGEANDAASAGFPLFNRSFSEEDGRGISWGGIPNRKFIEQLVHDRIISNWEAQDEPEHLRTIRDRILRNEQRAARLLGIYQQVLQRGEIATDDSPEQMELLLSGLVEKQQGFLKVKNPIYQNVFNLEWVKEQLASVRPYSQAFDAWIASQKQDASRLLRGQALKDAQTWAQGKSLSDLDYQFLAASQELDRLEVQLALEAERAKEVEARLAEEHKRLVLERKTAKRQRRFIGALSGVLLVAIASSILALWQYHRAVTSEQQARISEIQALTTSSSGQLASQQRLDALVSAIKARRRLDRLANSSPQLQSQVQQVLQQVWDVEFASLADNSGTKRPTIISASADNTVKLWQPDGMLLQTLSGHSSEVFEVAISTAGDVIASASADGTINLWKPDGTLLKVLKGHQSGIRGVTFIPNSQMLVSASDDNTARVWNPTNPFSKVLHGHRGTIWDVDFSPDGKMLASASSDGSFKVWARDGTLLKSFAGEKAAVYSVAFLAGTNVTNTENAPILAAASEDKTIKFWQFDGTLLKTLTGHGAGVWDIAISPDNRLFASASNDKTVKLWDKGGALLKTFQGHQARVYDVDFTPDGQKLVSASSDSTARLWSLDGKFSKSLLGHRSPIWEVAISPDGRTLATASRDDTIKLWTSDGALLKTLKGNTRRVMAVDFSPDGQMLVTGGSTGELKLWKTDGTEITSLTGHEGNVWGVVFSPDGRQMASAGDDRTVILWDVERILKLDELAYTCDLRFAAALRYRVRNYLRTNVEVKEEDRHLCDGVGNNSLSF